MGRKSLISNPEIDYRLREGEVDAALRLPIQTRATHEGLDDLLRSRRTGRSEDGKLYAGLTLGDFLYDYARIDPQVVEAIDFARAGHLSHMLSFAAFSDHHAELAGEALRGSVSQLQGYVAERVVAQHLEAQNFDVVSATTANQQGWDLLVDGQPFQVKCVSCAAAVRDHMELNPEIPVIVNSELAEEVGELPGVFVDLELSQKAVREATTKTLEAGRELADFEIPWISLAVSSAIALRDLVYSDTDLPGAVTTVLTDTAGRITLGSIGEVAGSVLGLALFGPAGGVVGSGVGAISGGVGGVRVGRAFRGLLARKEKAAVRETANALAAKALEILPSKIKAWQTKAMTLDTALSGGHSSRAAVRRYVGTRVEEDLVYFDNKRVELGAFHRSHASFEPVTAAQKVLTLITRAALHPHHMQEELDGLFGAVRSLETEQRRLRLK